MERVRRDQKCHLGRRKTPFAIALWAALVVTTVPPLSASDEQLTGALLNYCPRSRTTGETIPGFVKGLVLGIVEPFGEEIAKRSFDWLSQAIKDAQAGPKWLSPPFQTSGHFYKWEKDKPKLTARCLVVARGELGKPDTDALSGDSFWSANIPLAETLSLQAPPSFYFEAVLKPQPGEKPTNFALVPREVCLYKPGDLKPSGNDKYSITVGITFTHPLSSSTEEGTPLGVSAFEFAGLEPGGDDTCTRAPQGFWNKLPPNSLAQSPGLVNIEVIVSETGTDSSVFGVIRREGKELLESFGLR